MLLRSIVVLSLLGLPTAISAEEASPIERCRAMDFSLAGDKFDAPWKARVALEFEFVNQVDLPTLRAALVDKNLFVRAMAARALGIRGDQNSADTIAKLALSDPEYLVRVRAVEALGLLKLKPEVIEAAKKDTHGGVRWEADLSADVLQQKEDYAAQVRAAFATGIKTNQMAQAVVGKKAPNFTARKLDGKVFELSSVLGERPIIIYFAAFDS